MATAELDRLGWHLSDEGIAKCKEDGKASIDSIVKKALNTDLREIGANWLNEDINKGRLDYVEGPSVLQLQKLRVVSAPKENEDSQVAPRLCRLSLTDGHITCSAVTLEQIKGIGANTPPGTKVLLSGTVELETSFLLLTPKNMSLLGGRVDAMAESWELKKTLAKQTQIRASVRSEGGPPPFVPFGKKISNEPLPPVKKDSFKSLKAPADKKQEEEDSEFQQQRQATIKEAMQAKSSSGGVKTFGGGQKQPINDKDVAKIIEMGFSAEEATTALKFSGSDVNEAINSLLSGGQRFQRGGDRGRTGFRGGGHESRGEGRRRGREKDYEDDEDGPVNTRPSGPATLFDFLETKIPAKEESKSSKTSDSRMSSYQSLSSAPYSSDSSKFRDYNSRQPQRRPQASHPHSPSSYSQNRYESRKDNAPGFQGNIEFHGGAAGEDGSSYRRQQQQQQQSLPPRFAKLGRGDGQRAGSGRTEGRDWGSYKGDGGGGRYDGEGYEGKQSAYQHQNRGPLRESNSGSGQSYSQNERSYQGQHGRYNKHLPQNDLRNYSDDQSWDFKNKFHNQKSAVSVRGHGHEQDGRRNGGSSSARYNNNRNSDQNQQRGNQYRNSSHDNGDVSYTENQKTGPIRSYNKQQQQQQQQHPPQLISTSYQQPQYNQQFSPVDSQQFSVTNGLHIQPGEQCLARYWEDNEFYTAVVEAVATDGSTAVVTFVDYGNHEEVMMGDIQPLPQPGWGYQMPPSVYGMPGIDPSYQESPSFQGTTDYVPPMEFTRGGGYYNNNNNSGNSNRRRQDYNSDRRKPTQTFYQPPNQKSH